jgi:hypothetical protein
MVRMILVGVLVGCGVLMTPSAPIAQAIPDSCPPTCDQIPGTAWPDAGLLPLAAIAHWPQLASLAVPAPKPRFRFEELCAAPPLPDDPRGYAVAARAEVPAPPGQWQLRAQIVHWRGETWRGGALAASVFDIAATRLRFCQLGAPEFSPSLTTEQDNRLAAVISGPVTVHQYLLAHPQSSTISELVFWRSAGPAGTAPAPWSAPPDAQVLDIMAASLCEAYLASCG